MKKLLFLFVVTAFFCSAQSLPDISRALSQGQADALGQYFDATIELSVLDDENIYDKSTAVSKVNAFFKKYPPSSFNQVHQGSSKGSEAQYCIGHLKTSGGIFRVYIYMSGNGADLKIQELRFDPQ